MLNNSTVNEEKSEYNNFVVFEKEKGHEEGDYNEDGVIAIIPQKLFLMIWIAIFFSYCNENKKNN